ncbi:MAG TPA: M20/M25/M40 family metallo-hydrolase [Armatimonadota bacterium]|nr:M20/M25/M40 family metallo-hydrolase [Armatimonadota bacterium]
MIDRHRLVETFLRLAAINSPTGNEKGVADVLEADLRALGFDVLRDAAGERVNGDTGNVIAAKKGTVSEAVPILFNAHMDTVMPTEGWGYKIEDGVIRSNGHTILGADDKAGIAAVIEAMKAIQEEEIPHGDIQIVFSIGEEVGLWGAKYLDYSLITSKCAFVYDLGTPVGSVVVAAPSHDNIMAKIRGRAAHAGTRPEDGISAIAAAGKAISNMRLGRIDHETTANIGIISGGTARNIVPDFCEVKGEARSRDEKKLDAQVQHMVEAFHDAAAEIGASVEIEVERSYQAYRLSESDEVVRIAVAAARKVGIEPKMHETGGGSDASIFNTKGIPTIVIGVGYEKAHSTEEYLPISDFVKSAEMALAIVQVAAGA